MPVSALFRVRAALVIGLAGVFTTCSEHGAFDPIVACSDSQSVTIHVSAGLKPLFNWTPSCGMSSLQVLPDTGGNWVWALFSGTHSAENPLPSGIRYGVVPPKGIGALEAAPLVRGMHYRVVVYRWVADSGAAGSLLDRGNAVFTP